MTRRVVRTISCLVVCAFIALPASIAFAATWDETDITSLAGSLVAGDGDWLELPWTVIWELGPVVPGSPLDPRAVERLANGNTLITSRDSRGVFEVTPSGVVVWSYTTADDPLLTPFHAMRTPSGTTLVVDRWQETVVEVDSAGTVVWRYGVPDDPIYQGTDDDEVPEPGELIDPFQAVRLPNGNTLIAENQAGRVIEVRSADYVDGQPNDGYTEASVVWEYGVLGEYANEHDYASPYLDWPKYAQRLPNGNTLIADEAANLVLEVTPAKTVVWSYGTPGVSGSEPGYLNEPASAERLGDGTTLITDGKNNRVIRVDPDGEIVWEYSSLSLLGLEDDGLSGPRRAVLTDTGSILIADEGNDRLLELGYQPSGVGTSAQLDCGLPGARKRFSALSVDTDTPEGTSVKVQYSVDSGAWQTITGSALPADVFGTLIRYRVTLETSSLDTTPRLLGVSLTYEAAPTQPATDGGDDTGTGGDTDTTGGTTGGTTNRRPAPTTRPPGGNTPTSGVKRVGEAYTGTETLVGEPLSAGLTTQRGWTMAAIGTLSVTGDRPGEGAPAPALGGLAVLGIIYAAGIASVPAGRTLARYVRIPMLED
jgi:hypothetical protein